MVLLSVYPFVSMYSLAFIESITTSWIAFWTLMLHLLRMAVELVSVSFTCRYALMWFPNINPYMYPFVIVIDITQPYLKLFWNRLPLVFGINIEFFVASMLLTWVLDFLRSVDNYYWTF